MFRELLADLIVRIFGQPVGGGGVQRAVAHRPGPRDRVGQQARDEVCDPAVVAALIEGRRYPWPRHRCPECGRTWYASNAPSPAPCPQLLISGRVVVRHRAAT